MECTKGEDLKKVLWLKSENSEVWIERRTNYTRSLATMSMVGYIIGLGDRHLVNIMMERISGKIVHIDFGDLFEVTMTREKFPEKIPFRLTRVLTKAMEACGIEGNYRHTCNNVMNVLRENKDSLMAILEAFVTDPLLNWRLITAEMVPTTKVAQGTANKHSLKQMNFAEVLQRGGEVSLGLIQNGFLGKEKNSSDDSMLNRGRIEVEMIQNIGENLNNMNGEAEALDKKFKTAVERIRSKLVGSDFKKYKNLCVQDQVTMLIKQATSHENICQAYLGWNPFL